MDIPESSVGVQAKQSPTSSLSHPSHYSLSQSQVKIKILVQPHEETRGFAIQTYRLDEEYLDIMSMLTEDYGSLPSLTFIDSDGDVIQIKAKSDFLYAIECHLDDTQSSATINVSSKVLKLYATIPFPPEVLPSLPSSPKSVSVPTNANNLLSDAMPGRISKSISRSNLITGGSSSNQANDTLQGRPRSKSRKAVASMRLVWRKGEIIGSGSYGQVYSGVDLSTGQKLAVKEVSLGHGSNHRSQVRALEQEIKILSQLDHPNIIKYFGAEVLEGEHMRFFLDYADEGSVKDILNQFGT